MIIKPPGKTIYDYFGPETIEKLPLVTVKKNTVIIPCEAQEVLELYYIVSGNVDAYIYKKNGQKYLCDSLGPHDFVGKFSQMRNHNTFGELVAKTSCRMLRLTDMQTQLFNNIGFYLFFQEKITDRVYRMFKNCLVRKSFSNRELLAYHFLNFSDSTGLIRESDPYICLRADISARQFYYNIKQMMDEGLICREKDGLRILDYDALREIAADISTYMTNDGRLPYP